MLPRRLLQKPNCTWHVVFVGTTSSHFTPRVRAFHGAAALVVFVAIAVFALTGGIPGTFTPFAFQDATAFVVFFTIAGFSVTSLGWGYT
jgi:hypothetical protein